MNPRRTPLLLTLALLLNTLAPCLSTAAAVPTRARARFVGTVTQAGTAVPDATVRVRRKGTTSSQDVVGSTNSSGSFTFTDLEPSVAVVIALSGSSTATKFLTLEPGDNTAALDFDETYTQEMDAAAT